MLRATAEHHKAILDLRSLWAKHGGMLSTETLTAAAPEVDVERLEHCASFAAINWSGVPVVLNFGGTRVPLAPLSWIQMPLPTNLCTIAAIGLAEAQTASVHFIRYRHLVHLAAGALNGMEPLTEASITARGSAGEPVGGHVLAVTPAALTGVFEVYATVWETGTYDAKTSSVAIENPSGSITLPVAISGTATPLWTPPLRVALTGETLSLIVLENAGVGAVYHGVLLLTRVG